MAVSVTVTEKDSEVLFSSLDAWNGYHSVPLDKDSRNIFGFLCEFGTFRYAVTPQGFHGSGDHYVATYDKLMTDLRDKEREKADSVFRCFTDKTTTGKWATTAWKRCIDVTLLWSNNLETSIIQVMSYLSFFREKGIVFNPKKLKLGEKEMEIFGLKLDQQGSNQRITK